MRFVWAVVAFLIAAGLIGAGIAQRTVFLGEDSEQVSFANDDGVAAIVIDGEALTHLPGSQRLTVQGGEEEFVIAYGKSIDVDAWLSGSGHERISVDDAGALSFETIEGEPAASADAADAADDGAADETDAAAEEDAAAAQAINPRGADIWIEEFVGTDKLVRNLQLPENVSILVATDGTAAAPSVELSWRVDNATPWAGPLISLGVLVLLAGIVMYIRAIQLQRRSRGPRRKPVDAPMSRQERRRASRSGRADAVAGTENGTKGEERHAE